MEEVISIFESQVLKLHTTRSWDFMGLILDNTGEVTPVQLAYGDDIVVGIFDTGIILILCICIMLKQINFTSNGFIFYGEN